jgi:hypothetical protein
MRFIGLCLAVVALTACPSEKPKNLEPCRSFGQTCEFSPGKLGACVESTNPQSGNRFVCQSQH